MSELVGQSKARDQKEWETWYLSRYPKTVEQATAAIEDMLQKIIESARRIRHDDIRLWVEDLLLHKTFYGIYIQGPLLKKSAKPWVNRATAWRPRKKKPQRLMATLAAGPCR